MQYQKKRKLYVLLRCEVLVWVAFLAVARGPTMSQANRLICPTRGIQCIDERIVVAKQRLPETSISVRCFIHKEGDILDHRREPQRDPSVVRIVTPRRPRKIKDLIKDSKSTCREVGCTKQLSRTNTLTLFITE